MLRLLALESRANAQEREQAEAVAKLHFELQETTARELRHSKNLLVQSEKLSQLGAMLASIGHEIANPIMLISMSEENCTVTLDQLESKFMPIFTGNPQAEQAGRNFQEIIEALREINQATRTGSTRLKELSTALRTQSRMEQEATPGVLLNEVVKESMLLTGGRTKVHHLEEKLNDVPAITCFRSKIGQVITNLLANAADALSEKVQRLKGRSGEVFAGRIAVLSESTTKNGTPGVLLAVSDNGDGVPEDMRGKIFEEFYTTKPAGLGTGLGLSMCIDIVKEHGGILSVTDDPQLGGARFELWLPVTHTNHQSVEA
jgi:signal transduction histidine kinase